MKFEFQMTPEDHAKILAASSDQKATDKAWSELGARMKFKSHTVQKIEGKDQRFFTAEQE